MILANHTSKQSKELHPPFLFLKNPTMLLWKQGIPKIKGDGFQHGSFSFFFFFNSQAGKGSQGTFCSETLNCYQCVLFLKHFQHMFHLDFSSQWLNSNQLQMRESTLWSHVQFYNYWWLFFLFFKKVLPGLVLYNIPSF